MRPATVTTVYSGSTSPCSWLISCLSTARNSTATYRHHLRMVGADCCVSSRNRCAVLIEAANRECPHLTRRTRRLGGGGYDDAGARLQTAIAGRSHSARIGGRLDRDCSRCWSAVDRGRPRADHEQGPPAGARGLK